MKQSLLLIICVYFSLSGLIYGQELNYPAGVSEPYLWIKVKSNQVEDLIKKERLENLSISEKQRLNNHSIFKRVGNTEIKAILDSVQAEQISLFIVYEEVSKEEQILWTLSDGYSLKLVATTHRLANIDTKKYRSYPSDDDRYKIHYYQHRKIFNKNSGKIVWNLGESVSQLPPSSLGGGISEIILYDRVLSPIEMQQVASYLGIKYGISLSQLEYKNYYNSDGEVIWDYKTHKEFNQNITAVGRDKKGGISQFTSENANDEKLVSMSLEVSEQTETPDKYFVFWSDNGGAPKLKKEEGRPRGLERVWFLDYPQKDKVNLNWQFSSQKIKELNAPEESKTPLYYWLVVDTSSEFKPSTTEYVKLNKVSDNTPINYDGWDKFDSEQLNYTIWEAPEMFAHLDILEASCAKPNSGKIQFNMIGGEAPYQVELTSLENNSTHYDWTESNEKGNRELMLSSGHYRYQIKDASNQTYEQDFYLSDIDMPKLNLNQEYALKGSLVIDLEKELPKGKYTYEWYLDDKLISHNKQILINKSGDYKVRVRNAQGCQSISKFSVLDEEGLQKSDIVLYPNPSIDGHYQLLASFPKKTSGSLNVYNMVGQLLYSENFYNLSQYNYQGYIGEAGIYLVQVKTTFGTTTHKLSVK